MRKSFHSGHDVPYCGVPAVSEPSQSDTLCSMHPDLPGQGCHLFIFLRLQTTEHDGHTFAIPGVTVCPTKRQQNLQGTAFTVQCSGLRRVQAHAQVCCKNKATGLHTLPRFAGSRSKRTASWPACFTYSPATLQACSLLAVRTSYDLMPL